MEERFSVHAYKCVDCDRVFFATESHLPHRCPFCECPSVVRRKEKVEVTVRPPEAGND